MNILYTAPRYFRDENEKKIRSLFERLTDEKTNPMSEQNTRSPREKPVYSGKYVRGLATMHKSNITVVGSDDDPVNYSTMRRT